MDVTANRSLARTRRDSAPDDARALKPTELADALGRWQQRELRISRGFAECRGLSREQLEDIYQETVVALLSRPHQSEEHLRSALRLGIKQRAARFRRDQARHLQTVTRNLTELPTEIASSESAPENASLRREDRLLVTEFLAELDAQEQRVFWLIAEEGMSYRAIASALSIDLNTARKAYRSCETKRQRWQLLYDTGRLCGYRSQSIQTLLAGKSTSQELAQRAVAHLAHCAHCRNEHHLSASRLRERFQGQALVLLPAMLTGKLGRLLIRARSLLHRAMAAPTAAAALAREQASTLLAGSISAKVAAGAATAALLAGSAVGVTATLQGKRSAGPSSPGTAQPARVFDAPTAGLLQTTGGRQPQARPASARSARTRPGSRARVRVGEREPSGFAYLGVPPTTGASAAPPPGTPENITSSAGASAGRAGGPFSP